MEYKLVDQQQQRKSKARSPTVWVKHSSALEIIDPTLNATYITSNNSFVRLY